MKKCTKITILIFLATVWIFSCKVPTPPKWDTEINIPIGDGTFYLRDLLEDMDFIKLDSIPEICFTSTLDTIKITEMLRIDGGYEYCSFDVGNFNIKDISSGKVKISLGEIWPSFLPPLPEVSTLLDSVPSIPEVTLEMSSIFSHFGWASISEGKVILNVENHFDIPVYPLNIMVSDTAGTVLIPASFDTISPATAVSCTLDLGGLFITNNLKFEVSVGSPGTDGAPAYVSTNDSVLVWVELNSIVVDSAEASIPSGIEIYGTSKVGIPSDLGSIDLIRFREGTLDLRINNGTSLGGNLNLNIPSIDFDTTFYVAPQEISEFSILLQNRAFYLEADTLIEVISQCTLDSGFVVLRKSDSLVVEVALQDLRWEFIAGQLRDTVGFCFPSMDTIFGLPKGISVISFSEATLSIKLTNAIQKISANLSLDIVTDGCSRNFTLPIYPGVTDTTFDIAGLVNAALTGDSARISIGGEFSVFDSISIRYDDYMLGEISIGIPFRFALNADTIYSDTLKDSTTVGMAKSLRVATLSVNLKNRFPIGMGMRLVIAHESDTLSKTFAIPAAPYEPTTGIAVGEADTSISIGLDEGEAYIFTKRPRYEWFEIYIPGTGGDTVAIQTSDYVRVGGWATFKVRIGEF